VTHRAVVSSATAVDTDTAGLVPLTWTLTVPLVSGDRLASVLAFYSDVPFVEDQARVVELLAPHLAAGLAAVDAPRDSPAPVEHLRGARVLELKTTRGAGRSS
jgi:hypothetical protein